MSKHMYLAPSVEIVLFQRHLEVVKSAERVETSPGYWIRLPPHSYADAVCFRFVGTDVHHKTSIYDYLSFGHCLTWDEKIVSDPSILPPTPCANRPNSFAAALFQTGNVLSFWTRWRYSRLAPVSSLITEFAMGIF
jgi:hypothetical protein